MTASEHLESVLQAIPEFAGNIDFNVQESGNNYPCVICKPAGRTDLRIIQQAAIPYLRLFEVEIKAVSFEQAESLSSKVLKGLQDGGRLEDRSGNASKYINIDSEDENAPNGVHCDIVVYAIREQ